MQEYIDSYISFFEKTTNFKPYDFQKRLFENYLQMNNVLLKAPTGAGKTWASILPFVFANKEGTPSPKKIIYSLPLRTLANSLYNEISCNSKIKETGLRVSLQTGELPNDKYFESDIIFTTIDQTLSSILGFPYSLSKRQANINAGAIIGSYLIFDEFHLLDPTRSLTTSLNILKKLKELSRFCIMTATISDNTIREINRFLGSNSVTLDENEFISIPQLKNEKELVVRKKHLEATDIQKEHKKKTIVICNTVEKAQKLYLELEQKSKFELICIHSRFLKKDRTAKEKKILNIFGKKANLDREAILISTQVIEVGLDISCDTLLTEISPINSFLQRAGRCARFENEKGRIFVYNVQENENKNKSYLPYEENLCIATMKELANEKSINYATGERIVNTILTKKEIKEIENAKSFDFGRIQKAWEESDKGTGRDLIRDINSTSVIFLRKTSPLYPMYNYDAISINPYTLINRLRRTEELVDEEEVEPFVSLIEENNIFTDFEIARFKMSQISIEDIKIYPRIVLNPKYVNYNSKIGMNFLLKSKTIESSLQETEKKELFGYKKETYENHISSMIKIYETNFRDEIHYPLSKLWHKHNFTTPIDEMIKFMLIMHDYGKLNKKWQKIAGDFQKAKGNYNREELLAHTDFDSIKDKLPKKLPPHAGIGAIAAFAILEDILEDDEEFETIARALTSAIIKHHSATSHWVNSYQIEREGINLVLEMIRNYASSFYKFDKNNEVIRKWDNEEDLNQYTVNFGKPDETFLYFVLVRILRLCDQQSINAEDKDVSK